MNKEEINQLPEGNRKLILKEFEKLKGQFVITCSWKIERLVAIGDDGEDWYWITYNGRKLTWNTCVGRVVPLKGYLRQRDYDEFIRLAKLNHWDQTCPKDMFQSALKEKLDAYSDNHKFLTEFCWELV